MSQGFAKVRGAAKGALMIVFTAAMLLVLVASQGCNDQGIGSAGSGGSTLRDLQTQVQGKSQEQVLAILGKPFSIAPTGRTDEEMWSYENMVRHPVTGQSQGATLHFTRGTCTEVTTD